MQTVVKEKEEQTDNPLRYDVPIIATIAEEDVRNAGEYSDHQNCLLATTLKRMGYGKKQIDVSSRLADIDGHQFSMEGSWLTLGWSPATRTYDKNMVGKQIVFYPE